MLEVMRDLLDPINSQIGSATLGFFEGPPHGDAPANDGGIRHADSATTASPEEARRRFRTSELEKGKSSMHLMPLEEGAL
jgi:hypothetical protein